MSATATLPAVTVSDEIKVAMDQFNARLPYKAYEIDYFQDNWPKLAADFGLDRERLRRAAAQRRYGSVGN